LTRTVKGWKKGAHNCKDPIDPAVSNAKSDKAEDEGRNRYAERDKDGPDTYVSRSLPTEERLGHDGTADGGSGADEKGHEGSACCHGAVVGAFRTTDVANQTANQRKKENWPAAEANGQRTPEQRSSSKNGDLESGKVANALDGLSEIGSHNLISRNDCRSNESRHHSMECHEDQVGQFLE